MKLKIREKVHHKSQKYVSLNDSINYIFDIIIKNSYKQEYVIKQNKKKTKFH